MTHIHPISNGRLPKEPFDEDDSIGGVRYPFLTYLGPLQLLPAPLLQSIPSLYRGIEISFTISTCVCPKERNEQILQ
jgi:hypothetical protein